MRHTETQADCINNYIKCEWIKQLDYDADTIRQEGEKKTKIKLYAVYRRHTLNSVKQIYHKQREGDKYIMQTTT